GESLAEYESLNSSRNPMIPSINCNNLLNPLAINNISSAASSPSSSTSQITTTTTATTTSSRYENQKRRDWNTFGQYLKNHKPPLTLSICSGAHVLEFLRYKHDLSQTF
ncbi:hypothetical protein Drorol1_Dr00022234, partial [Drosera rotundifolia]